MSDQRQLPLFASQPTTVADLSIHTRLVDAIPFFQAHLHSQGKTQHTIDAFTADLELLTEYYGGAQDLGWYTTSRLNDFLIWMEERRGIPCSRKTYARRVTTLKVLFRWLKEIEAIPYDPATALLQRSGPAPLAVILTSGETEAVMAYARGFRFGDKPDARPELLFRLILSTGIKKNEAVRLVPDDIQADAAGGWQVFIRHEGVKDRYRERFLPLDSAIQPALDAYLSQYSPQTGLFTCTARNLEYILEDLGKGAGIPNKISFEMLRWMYGVRAFLAEADPNTIRERLGLSEISWLETFGKIKQLAVKYYPARL
ncbi:MAG: tyrosine-type recombinase/integrase [Anaerolineae bacterium]|nr:tyrosine-type recombinase/integrase [Anaerolineae bacterium]NUQ02247.1 tyrosine-type recombinase/integrase [Anaerolineae bacterium]